MERKFPSIKLLLLSAAALLIFFSPLRGQNPLQKQFDMAERLYNEGLYFDAVTEYKRLQFFDSLKQYEYASDFKIAMSYKMGGMFDNAILYFVKAEKSAPSPKEKYESEIQNIRTNILRKTTPRALELLAKLEADSVNGSNLDEIHYWKGWAYMFGDDFARAALEFSLSAQGEELKNICLATDAGKYSVTFAKVISYILPGAGEIYTGNYLQGILSLGWNLASGYWMVSSFAEKKVLEGILIGDLLFLRFYRGNIQNASKYAVEKNLEITNKTLFYIQNNYRGIKP